ATRGAPSRRPPPLRPHPEQEHAGGDAVHGVLRLPRLYVAERIPRAERPRPRGVETSVDEIAVDEADEAREAEQDTAIERTVDRVEEIATAGQEVDGRQRAAYGFRRKPASRHPACEHDALAVHRPREENPGRRQREGQGGEPRGRGV